MTSGEYLSDDCVYIAVPETQNLSPDFAFSIILLVESNKELLVSIQILSTMFLTAAVLPKMPYNQRYLDL